MCCLSLRQREALSEKADVTYVEVWGHEREADIIQRSSDSHTVPTGPVTAEVLFRFVFLTLSPFWKDSFGPFPQPPCEGLVQRELHTAVPPTQWTLAVETFNELPQKLNVFV